MDIITLKPHHTFHIIYFHNKVMFVHAAVASADVFVVIVVNNASGR